MTSCQEDIRIVDMQLLTVGQFKANFSQLLEKVLHGDSVGITYGKSKKKVAALIPYGKLMKQTKFKLGVVEDKAAIKIHHDFKMTDEEFLRP